MRTEASRRCRSTHTVLVCFNRYLRGLPPIAFIKAEKDEEKKASYLREMETVVSIHEAEAVTGNSVLDTILTSKNLLCAKSGITMTCFADAAGLERLDVMDICSIFGNYIGTRVFEKGGTRAVKPVMILVIGIFMVRTVWTLMH